MIDSKISSVPKNDDTVLVFSFNIEDFDLDSIENIYKALKEKIPNRDIVILPDSISLEECDDDGLRGIIAKIEKFIESREKRKIF